MALGKKFFYLTLVRHGQTESNKSQILQGQLDTLLSETGRQQVSQLSSYFSSLGIKFDLIFSSDLTRAVETAEIILNEYQPSEEPRRKSSDDIDSVRRVEKSSSSDSQELTDSGHCSGTESDTGLSSSTPSPSNFTSLVSLSDASSACSSPCVRMKVDSRLRERSYGILEGKTLKELRDARAAGYNEKNYTSWTPPGGESLEQVRQRITDFCCTELMNQVVSVRGSKMSTDRNRESSCKQNSPECITNNVSGHVSSTDQQNISDDSSDVEDVESLDTPVSVLITTHGGVIREFKRYFRDYHKCLLSPLHEPLQVTPNTGVNIFKVYYEYRKKKQCNIMTNVDLLVYHDITHLEEKSSEIHTLPPHSNAISALIDSFVARQTEIMKLTAETTPVESQFEAL